MKRSTILFLMLASVSLLVLAACNGNGDDNENAADYQGKTEVDDKQLPISTIRTDQSSNHERPETKHIRFNGEPNDPNQTDNNRGRDQIGRDNNRLRQEDPLERNLRENDRDNNPQVRQDPAGQEPIERNGNIGQQQGINEYASKVIELTNEERRKQGLSALKSDKQVSRVARNKSMDMQQKGYFSHTSPTYGSPFNMMKQFNVTYQSAGENIAKGQRTPQQVVDAWMDSKEHRKNILDESFTHIGVGFTEKGKYWTQMFIEK
ncbi:SCP-like extracellular protein [Lentibacillus lipolyticus]|nr:SCP-like extracellular protein [Lentibacillus lipolyticus]